MDIHMSETVVQFAALIIAVLCGTTIISLLIYMFSNKEQYRPELTRRNRYDDPVYDIPTYLRRKAWK